MDQLLKDFEQKIKSIIDSLRQEFLNIRTNRPTAKLVEDIKVDYLDQQFLVKQLGSISVAPPKEIDISIWDKDAVIAVAKAIQEARGLTPNIDGNLIRVRLPSLTQERREEFSKLVKGSAEQIRIKIRGSRDDANKRVELMFKDKTISEDQKFKSKKKIQDAVDKVNQELESLLAAKIKEINE